MSKTITALFVLASAAIIGYFFAWPAFTATKAANAEIAALSETNQEMLDLLAKSETISRAYNSVSQNDLDKLAAIAPKFPEQLEALIDVDSIARKNGMVISQVDVGTASGQASVQSVNQSFRTSIISLAVSGGYEPFVNFLADMEKNLRIIDVDEIYFSATGAKSYSFSLKAKAYSQP